MEELTGRVALVTGGARGIGLGISKRLAASGAHVAIGYSSNPEPAEQFTSEHPGSTAHKGNIGSQDDCQRVFAEVIDAHGKLDILVNNAGINADYTLTKMDNEAWDRVLQVNLSGTFYLSRLAFLHMRERGAGRIINISSIIGEKGNFGQTNYSAAKSGLFGLTMSMALEGAKKGVTVNCVTPGFVNTDMVASMPEKALDALIAQIPMGRLGEPEEVARVVEFLAAPESSYITGQVYSINGGHYM
jgi:NAD(P)-dependent dehydrogenase (short-subunit alcohol dehydrogenase family)